MKRIALYCGLAVLAGAAFFVGAAEAALGDIVASFRGPPESLHGVARSNEYLFVQTLGYPNRVYRCNPTTGSIYGSWAAPVSGSMTLNRGLAYSWGGHVWVGRYYPNQWVFDCDAETGSVYGSWNPGHNPYGLAPRCTGDGGAGTTALFSQDINPHYTYVHRLTGGRLVGSFPMAESFSYDIAYDHRNRLIWTNHSYYFYGFDASTGSTVATFDAPTWYSCVGAAYYGEYLWISGAGNIYQVHCPVFTAVAPASLGRVKTLFR
jgi:hypothetical protein